KKAPRAARGRKAPPSPKKGRLTVARAGKMGEQELWTLVEELQREGEKKEYVISSMKEIGHALSTTLSQEHLLQLIIGKITALMEADRSSLFIVDQKAGELWSLIAQGEGVQEIRLPIGKGIAGNVAKDGNIVNIPDAYADKRFNPEVDKKTGYRTRSILCMPIRSSTGKVLGVVQVLNKKDGIFTKDDEDLLDALCAQAALSLQNSELYASLEREHLELAVAQKLLQEKVAQIDMLYAIEREMTASKGLEDLLDSVTDKTLKFLNAEAGSILLIEEGTNQLFFKVALGEKSQEVKRLKLNVGEGVVGWVAQHGEPLVVADTYLDERFRKDIADQVGFPAKSIVCVPLRVENKTIGAIELINKVTNVKGQSTAFTQDDAKLLQLISAQVAKAIHVAHLRDREARNERLATVGQMISGLMHDMQTPMTSIVGFVELMSLPETTAEERKEFSDIVKKEVDRLTQMIRAHLDFVKGKSDVLLKKIGVYNLVEEMAQFLEKDFKDNQIAIRTEVGYRGNIRIDESKFRRAFYNLAKNAKEAMPKGGTFSIAAQEQNGHIIFRFSDTGSGIPEQIRDKLFQSFVTFGKENGTGLGLAQVKSFVDQHKGRIEVESEVGKGTTFVLRLPKGV
ncbi:MAG: GAF domain-containing sensor histidine kinase, partial [Bdellovibrionota bacterium]